MIFFSSFATHLLTHSIFPHGVDSLLVQLLRGLDASLVLGERLAHGARLLPPQVLGLEGFIVIEFPQVLLLGLVDDGQHARHRLLTVLILESLEAAPPVTAATRSCDSSV